MTTCAVSDKTGDDSAATATIAAQNDAFRRLACLGISPDHAIPGRLHITRGLIGAGAGVVTEAVSAVGDFERFDEDNDPDGLHDFGAVDIRGQKVFWKLDLYEADSEFRYGAEDPANPETTIRVLTIMLASDW